MKESKRDKIPEDKHLPNHLKKGRIRKDKKQV